MLRVGAQAPEIRVKTTLGAEFVLSKQRGRIVVIYFFRKAFTRNCTVETKGFRDNYADLHALGAEVVGVSCDSFDTQCRFAMQYEVSFPMVADTDRSISREYDVFFPILTISHRVTYVVGPEGSIAGVFNHEFAVNRHLDEVLRFVHEQATGRRMSTRPPHAHD